MEAGETLHISVVYALPQRQHVVQLKLQQPATVADALASSGLLQRFPELAAGPLECAIYGRPVVHSRLLQPNDRVEILRPLRIDPKQARRQAAARARTKSAGGR